MIDSTGAYVPPRMFTGVDSRGQAHKAHSKELLAVAIAATESTYSGPAPKTIDLRGPKAGVTNSAASDGSFFS